MYPPTPCILRPDKDPASLPFRRTLPYPDKSGTGQSGHIRLIPFKHPNSCTKTAHA